MNGKCHNSQLNISEKTKVRSVSYAHDSETLEHKSNNKKSFISTTNFMEYKMMPQFSRCYDDWSWRVQKPSEKKNTKLKSSSIQLHPVNQTDTARSNDSSSGCNVEHKNRFLGVLKAWALSNESAKGS